MEPVRWQVAAQTAAAEAPAERALFQLASIAQRNEVEISITAERVEDALTFAQELEARGVPSDRIGVALRSGPSAHPGRVEVLLDVIQVGADAPVQSADITRW